MSVATVSANDSDLDTLSYSIMSGRCGIGRRGMSGGVAWVGVACQVVWHG